MKSIADKLINSLLFLCLQLIHYTIMFEEISSNHQHHQSQNSGTYQTNEERMNRIKKSKNIRKDKVKEKRNQFLQSEVQMKHTLSKDQKKEIQKEKNRVAAQLSRDRQKKYVEDLEVKIIEMQKLLESQLCRKCKAALSDHSTTEEEQSPQELFVPFMKQPENNQLSILNLEPQVEQLPLVRDNSRTDLEWGNIGRYFCIVLVVLAVALLSSSVETTGGGVAGGKQVARLLTAENGICPEPTSNHGHKTAHKAANTVLPSTIQLIKSQSWPFKQGTGEPIEQCKNDFWKNYLENVKRQVLNPYDWNLVTCNSPNLVHISTVYENSVNSMQGKWTFLITNPTVSHSHIESNGNYYVDEASYLEGVYQMVAQKVVLKKVMGKNCLA